MYCSRRAGFSASLAVLCSVLAWAQDSKSEALAKQLASALGAAKLEHIAAADPSNPDFYIGALYIPGSQLMVVTARFPVPAALDHKISSKEYRDVYLDLSAGAAIARIVIVDMGANGLSSKRQGDDVVVDSVDVEGKRVLFDGQPQRQKLTSDDYQNAFSNADARYLQVLQALLAQLKKGT